MNLKWCLMYVPWPLKVGIYLGGLIFTARLSEVLPIPVFVLVMIFVAWGMHYILGPHPDLVRPELRPPRR